MLTVRIVAFTVFTLFTSAAYPQTVLASIAKESGILATSAASGAIALQLINAQPGQSWSETLYAPEEFVFYTVTGLTGIGVYNVIRSIFNMFSKQKKDGVTVESIIPAYVTTANTLAFIVTVSGCLGLLGIERGSFLITSLIPYVTLKTLTTHTPKTDTEMHVPTES